MTEEARRPPLEKLLQGAETLGVIGSPSSTSELAMDIMGTAVHRKLVGELALFPFRQDEREHYALGQITEVRLRNVWHEDPTVRSLVRQRGAVDAVSKRQDTHLGKMMPSAVFCRGDDVPYKPSTLGTVPATGTRIRLVSDKVLEELLRPYQEQVFYLGNVYGSEPRLPMWFKHFGRGPDGAGEAYHLGIFGRTGSGKSVLAKMILLAYARYPQMALLVIDPQGEFAKDAEGAASDEGFAIPVGGIARQFGKQTEVLSVRNLVLDRWELFEEILHESRFFEELTIPKGDNRRIACRILIDRLKKRDVKLAELHRNDSFKVAWELLGDPKVQTRFYRSAEARERFDEARADADPESLYQNHWAPAARLFHKGRTGARSVDSALRSFLAKGRGGSGSRGILVIDLSGEASGDFLWGDRIQELVIRRLLEGISLAAERSYAEGESLNALVAIDEAHRFAPRNLPDDKDVARDVRGILVDAARTTRKYGLGWLFISQTLSSLHADILHQLRISFFGFGLGLGQEFQSLRELAGSSGTALKLYQSFLDPHSAFDIESRQYSFMTIGPVSPLSFAGTPLFLSVFNRAETFLKANGLKKPGYNRTARLI